MGEIDLFKDYIIIKILYLRIQITKDYKIVSHLTAALFLS